VPLDERRHGDCAVEEWWFSCWDVAAAPAFGLVVGWRIMGTSGWYWTALARQGRPLLHMTEWSVPLRPDPMIAKAHEMWGELECVAAFDQWTVANEMYVAELDDADEALGRAHGRPTPMAMDLEWYATSSAENVEQGYRQSGVVHGLVELHDEPLEIREARTERWHRWGSALPPSPSSSPVSQPATAHLGMRAPFAFPDGSVADLVMTGDGWRTRQRAPE
jgi:hypothetical protein